MKARIALAGFLLAAGLTGCLPPEMDAPDSIARGKQLFRRGVSLSGNPVRAALSGQDLELSGSSVACARCHGSDGKGSSEGGIVAPDIRARRLFAATDSPYSRPAYGERSLLAALHRGRSSSGRALNPVMPRFRLSKEEQRDLLAYLRILGTGQDTETGVTSGTVVFGTIVPDRGQMAGAGRAIRSVLEAYFSEINAQGGVYRRKLELKVRATPEALSGEEAFAWVGGLLPPRGPWREGLGRSGLPVIAPLGEEVSEEESSLFFLYPGVELQARLAARHARKERTARFAVIYPESPSGNAWHAGVKLGLEGGPRVSSWSYAGGEWTPDAAARWLRASGASIVFFGGSGEELKGLIARTSGRIRWITPLASARGLLSDAAGARVLFTHPGQMDRSEPVAAEATREFLLFLERNSLGRDHLAFRIHAYLAARLSVEAVKRSGAELTRPALIGALESLREFKTGLAPALSFARSRRVGIQGIHLVRWDRRAGGLAPASPWLEASDRL